MIFEVHLRYRCSHTRVLEPEYSYLCRRLQYSVVGQGFLGIKPRKPTFMSLKPIGSTVLQAGPWDFHHPIVGARQLGC